MARYCIKFETMKVVLSLGAKPKMSEIVSCLSVFTWDQTHQTQLSALSQAEEYRDIRLKAGEKPLYKEINKANGIKYPIKVDLALHAHKRSLLIQAELGGVEFPADEQYNKHRRQFSQDRAIVFSHVNRLIRCIVDCQLYLQDSVGARHALELARSLSARVWDNSPLQMKQLPQVGLAAIRKLAMGGVNSIEALEITEPHRIETLLSKNPPFGQKLLASLRDFPKLRLSMRVMGTEIEQKQSVKINIKAECGFLNDKPPTIFHRRLIYVCLLVERSDGLLIDFRRISGKKLVNGQDISMSAPLTQHDQHLTSYIMCDEIAGTLRFAELKHNLPASVFPQPFSDHRKLGKVPANDHEDEGRAAGKQRLNGIFPNQQASAAPRDEEFSDSDFNDQEFIALANVNSRIDQTCANTGPAPTQPKATPLGALQGVNNETAWNPTQLDNGKWACNHKCKDKSACKHLCCREGVDKAPKPPKCSAAATEPPTDLQKAAKMSPDKRQGLMQSKLTKQKSTADLPSQDIHMVDGGRGREIDDAKVGPRNYTKLRRLHEKINKAPSARILSQAKPVLQLSKAAQPHLSFSFQKNDALGTVSVSSEYEDDWMDNLPSTSDLLPRPPVTATQAENFYSISSEKSFEDDVSDIEAALVGMDDSTAIANDLVNAQNTALPDDDDDLETHGNRGEREEDAYQHHLQAETAPKPKAKRLFLSTDSPERPDDPTDKRKADMESDLGNSGLSSGQITKKRRTANRDVPVDSFGDTRSQGVNPDSSQTLDPPTSKAEQIFQPLQDSNAHPPLPEWTKEIDPGFLAHFVREYGHLVEWWPEDTQEP